MKGSVSDKAQRTLRIKWVHSAIAFPRRQKEMIRSLGLRRLNQVVERPDTPQVRGLVARVPHLVEVVERETKELRFPGPEYTLLPAEAEPVEVAPARTREAVEAVSVSPAPGEVLAPEAEEPVPAVEGRRKRGKVERAPARAKAAKAKRAEKPAAGGKKKAAKAGEAKKSKAAAGKATKSTKTGKK